MKPPSGFSLAFALLVCLSAVGTPVLYAANQATNQEPPRGCSSDQCELGQTQVGVSQREAAERARQAYPGSRVLSIRLENDQWLLRMELEGTVFNVLVDANSGRVRRAD
ncbi:MAG: hypothetical protein LBF16_14120 [Pseudomonadales bacterium]|jgi:uncharacterized membrane protein YkoI|nr:hypothetical protein [Pseudomonadales bacterium]